MPARKERFYTPEEYLALEEQAEYKSEYHQGQIVAMASESLNHNRVAGNVCHALTNVFAEGACETFIGDVRLWIERKKIYTYPDVMVVCGEPEFLEGRSDTIINPKVILEVLSKSTAMYDRSDKFHAYWSLDSFEEYVLIDQYRVHVEYFRRVDEKMWELRVLTSINEVLELKSVAVKIPLSKIYRNVKWEE
ncbi:MAG: Uma2 family endonuclease [Ardenticatenaceae bacterium]